MATACSPPDDPFRFGPRFAGRGSSAVPRQPARDCRSCGAPVEDVDPEQPGLAKPAHCGRCRQQPTEISIVTMIGALALLFVCQLVGEVVHRLAGLPLPGSVIGMLLL